MLSVICQVSHQDTKPTKKLLCDLCGLCGKQMMQEYSLT